MLKLSSKTIFGSPMNRFPMNRLRMNLPKVHCRIIQFSSSVKPAYIIKPSSIGIQCKPYFHPSRSISTTPKIQITDHHWIQQEGKVLSDGELAVLNEQLVKMNQGRENKVAVFLLENLVRGEKELQQFTDDLQKLVFKDPAKVVLLAFFKEQRSLNWRAGLDEKPILTTTELNRIGLSMVPHFRNGLLLSGLEAGLSRLNDVMKEKEEKDKKKHLVNVY